MSLTSANCRNGEASGAVHQRCLGGGNNSVSRFEHVNTHPTRRKCKNHTTYNFLRFSVALVSKFPHTWNMRRYRRLESGAGGWWRGCWGLPRFARRCRVLLGIAAVAGGWGAAGSCRWGCWRRVGCGVGCQRSCLVGRKGIQWLGISWLSTLGLGYSHSMCRKLLLAALCIVYNAGKCLGAQKLTIGLRAVDPQRMHIIQEKFFPLEGGNDLCWSDFKF